MFFSSIHGSRTDLGKSNRRTILASILLDGPISRTELAKKTGLTGAAVSRITRQLIDAGLIFETDQVIPSQRAGRRLVNLDVNGSGGCVLGIGLNVFEQAITISDLKNRRLYRRDLKLSRFDDSEQVIGKVIEAAREAVAAVNVPHDRILAGAVAITGAVDPMSGTVHSAPVFGWQDVELGPRLESALNIPMRVENLANSINLAEMRFGQAQDCRNAMQINASLGVGASLVLDDRLVRGDQFAVGIIGNMPPPYIQPGDRAPGPMTLDGQAGGWSVMTRVAGDTTPTALSGDQAAAALLDLVSRSNAGEGQGSEAFAAAGRVLGRAIVTFAGLVRPEIIGIAGPLAKSKVYFETCTQTVKENFSSEQEMPSLVNCSMSAQAAARWLALGESLCDRDLDLHALQMEEAA